MISKDVTFTIKEIAEASGLPVKTLSTRAKQFRDKGVFPKGRGRETIFYTYDQVRMIIAKPKRKTQYIRPSRVTLLKTQLQNDGYKINKGPIKEGT